MINPLFWMILGFGIAIPFTVVTALNIFIKVRNPDNYDLHLYKLCIVYIIALLGWAILIGIR